MVLKLHNYQTIQLSSYLVTEKETGNSPLPRFV